MLSFGASIDVLSKLSEGLSNVELSLWIAFVAGSLLVLLIRYAAASFVVVKEHLATKMRMVIRATNLNMSWGHNVLATDVSYN